MTRTVTAFTTTSDSVLAGQELGKQIRTSLGSEPPDVVIVFASARYAAEALLASLAETCLPKLMVGASSAGEFTGAARAESSACALAIRSHDLQFSAGIGHGVGRDRAAAAAQVVTTFKGLRNRNFAYRTALVMTDALAGHADDLVEQLTIATSGAYEFAGGGAGDDAMFDKTYVFHGTRAYSDAVVALEILSNKPLGIGAEHGWAPGSEPMRVTEADGTRLVGVDGFPAVEAFEQHAQLTGQRFDRNAPLPFFLNNIIGIESPAGHRLRVPLSIDDAGVVTCASEVPVGSRVSIMKTTASSAAEAAVNATRAALRALVDPPAAALFFDCVATRLRLGDAFGNEVEAVQKALGASALVGCNTYGQIARAAGQFGGFHNCTAVVLAFPR